MKLSYLFHNFLTNRSEELKCHDFLSVCLGFYGLLLLLCFVLFKFICKTFKLLTSVLLEDILAIRNYPGPRRHTSSMGEVQPRGGRQKGMVWCMSTKREQLLQQTRLSWQHLVTSYAVWVNISTPSHKVKGFPICMSIPPIFPPSSQHFRHC